MKRIMTALVAALFVILSAATSAGTGILLPADAAFSISVRPIPDKTIMVDCRIAPGYALYRVVKGLP